MKHRIAFIGFRHPHILSLFDAAAKSDRIEIVAASESHAATREQLAAAGVVKLTHSDYAQLLADTDASLIAIGDVYAKRGTIAIAALKAGKHIILDKPIATDLDELREIEALAAESKLSVGCQLDMPETKNALRLREVIQSGELGDIVTFNISAQHPLRYGTRADWYFEPGQHGGTINDIGIHIFDLVPWLVSSPWKETVFAREWNAKAVAAPHFKDCAQFYGILESGAVCYSDVSYLAPDKLGYALPQYWRILAHGTKGVAECSYDSPHVTVITDEAAEPRYVTSEKDYPGYFKDFLNEVEGNPNPDGLTTERVLRSSRRALEAQAKASAA